MPWILDVVLQQRDSKDESSETVWFDSNEEARLASEKLRGDVSKAGPVEFIIVASPHREISFLKQDFRRSRVYERKPPGQTRVVI